MREGDRFLKTSDGGEVSYRVDGPPGGSAPLMLIYNGLVSGPMHWRYWLSHYSRDFRVITWHYRGHGPDYAAPCELSRVSIEGFAQDGHEILQAVGGGPAIIAGISMGVQASLEHMRKYASDAAGLVLLCGTSGHPLNRLGGGEKVRRAIVAATKLLMTAKPIARALMSPFINTPLGAQVTYLTGGGRKDYLPASFLPELFAHVAKMNPRVIAAIVGSWAMHTAEDVLPSIRVPTLIFAGGNDDLTPPSLAQVMQNQIPDAELHVIEGHSHLLQVERPELVHRITDEWLSRKVFGAVQKVG